MSVPFLYKLNKTISAAASGIVRWITPRSPDAEVDLRRETIRKILLVRGNFRMGGSVLASPAIFLLRKNFPDAAIHFVGSPMSRALFENLPIDRHFEVTRRFPDASWSYLTLLKRIRAERYDLAVDASGSQSAMGAFIVGFSGARLRAGVRGKRDRWLNIRLDKPAERNKYRALPAFIAALGLASEEIFPSIILAAAEKAEGRRRMEKALGTGSGPIVAVFVGGRASRQKRVPSEFFIELAKALKRATARGALFVGPEEKSLIGFFKRSLGPDIPVLFEPSVRMFAAMVAGCDLFVTADSGPMHLACAVRTRTVAIFQKADHRHWGPPESLARIVYRRGGATVEEVLNVCLKELSAQGTAQDRKDYSRSLS